MESCCRESKRVQCCVLGMQSGCARAAHGSSLPLSNMSDSKFWLKRRCCHCGRDYFPAWNGFLPEVRANGGRSPYIADIWFSVPFYNWTLCDECRQGRPMSLASRLLRTLIGIFLHVTSLVLFIVAGFALLFTGLIAAAVISCLVVALICIQFFLFGFWGLRWGMRKKE